jgi:hypothetical protein
VQKSSSDNGPKMARNVFNCCGVSNFLKHCSQVSFIGVVVVVDVGVDDDATSLITLHTPILFHDIHIFIKMVDL